jgi:DNA (cytosine-5)-methyltransferase 1
VKVLDLFSGIGGFSLGLERAGMQTVAFCEIEPYPRAVLRKHWPDVPCYDDVRTLTADRLAADGIGVDVICGGFPCQDISFAGKGAGLAGERSGLWREIARLVGEIRPRYVILENVAALLSRGLGDVLGDLAALGYDAEWHCIPASYVGASHRRDRIWIVGYPNDQRKPDGAVDAEASGLPIVANTDSGRLGRAIRREVEQPRGAEAIGGSEDVAYPGRNGGESDGGLGYLLSEPDVGRVAHGVPARVDRLRCLGNAVVPQIPEIIGRVIMENERRGAEIAAKSLRNNDASLSPP